MNGPKTCLSKTDEVNNCTNPCPGIALECIRKKNSEKLILYNCVFLRFFCFLLVFNYWLYKRSNELTLMGKYA